MTLEEIKALDDEIIYPQDISLLVHMCPQEIRDRAKQDPASLGFRTILSGRKRPTVHIPRRAFIAYMEGGPEH